LGLRRRERANTTLRFHIGVNNLSNQSRSKSMSDPSTDQIKEEMRQYILNEFLPGEKASNLHDDTPLRSSGIIDSVGLLRMIDFIESRYTIQVDAHEAGVENFDRIEDMATFIQNKRRAGA
jgi:acyl carrier protein